MNILIVSATSLEIEPFKKKWNHLGVPGVSVRFLVTGVGQVQACYVLLKLLTQERPDFVLAAGIGGTFSAEVVLGSVFQVTTEIFADLGVQESSGWWDMFDLKLADPMATPFRYGRLDNPAPPMSINAAVATGATVNQITTDALRMNTISQRYRPIVESMEGAAFHYVCLRENIPFVHLRSVSNVVGERNKEHWEIKKAINNLSEAMYEALKNYVSNTKN